MPYDVRLRPESRVGLVTGSGHVTGHELAQACEHMVQHPQWELGFDEVWDLSESGEVDVSPEELDRLVQSAHAYADRIGQNRCVFVTTRGGVQALLRLFELLTRDLPREYQTVGSRAEAASWLGLAADALDDAATRALR